MGFGCMTKNTGRMMKANKPIFVVMGETGEYSDRTEWPVKAFRSETDAELFIKRLEVVYRNNLVMQDKHQRVGPDGEKAVKKLDPNFQEDYTGTRWYWMEVELEN